MKSNLLLTGFIILFQYYVSAQSLAWVHQLSGSGSYTEYIMDADVDSQNNVVGVGTFRNAIDFDLSVGTNILTPNGLNLDIFFVKYDENGNHIWAKKIGGEYVEEAYSIDIDANDNIILAGGFDGNCDFDPSASDYLINSGPSWGEAFIAKYDDLGNFQWVVNFGDPSHTSSVLDVKADASGNIYATGHYRGTVNFNPLGTAQMKTSINGDDAFLAKYNSSGILQWVYVYGGITQQWGRAIDIDANGNVYSLGTFNGTVDFNPTAVVQNFTAVGADTWFSKYDANGTYLWTKILTGNFDVIGLNIVVDGFGNLKICGELFISTTDFDPGPGTAYLTTTPGGQTDFFLASYDNAGNYQWAFNVGGANLTITTCSGLDVDALGDVYVSGLYGDVCDFDPGPGTAIYLNDDTDNAFFAKYSIDGDYQWVTSIGEVAGLDNCRAVVLDQENAVYAAGYFDNTADLDPSVTNYNLTAGGRDAFLAKYGQCGNITSVNTEICAGDSLFFNGSYRSTAGIYFDSLQNFVACDSIVVLNLSISPAVVFNQAMTSCDSAQINGTWYYNSQVVTDVYDGMAFNGCDSTVNTNLNITNSNTGMDTQTACGSYTWIDGNTYFSSNNTATYLLSNAATCDSLVTLNLTINNSTTGTDVQTACDSYTWIDGNTYFASNNSATHILQNAALCDSLVTLNLTITNSTAGTDVQTACDSYTWIDGITYFSSNNSATFLLSNAATCDSLVTLNLTINHSTTGTDIQTACDSYTWIDGNTYLASNNTMTYTMQNASLCDSVITLNLTINNVDVSTTEADPTITADLNGAAYQWIDCDNGNAAISGATSQSFTATSNGNYAVIVTDANCSDTSACTAIVSLGLQDLLSGYKLSVYPNPSTGLVTIEFESIQSEINVTVRTLTGQIIKELKVNDALKVETLIAEASGIYFIEIANHLGKNTVIRLIKE